MRALMIFGTRPEAIKMAPVCSEFRRRGGAFQCHVCVTAQHREMLDAVLEIFEVAVDHDLDVMVPDQSLERLTREVLERVPPILAGDRPDVVLVQGDTTTAMAAALCAFYEHIPVAHVEAGLRTGDVYAPFPEEINRRLITQLARDHFAPTGRARDNLLREGIAGQAIVVTGNTGIDALLRVVERARALSAPPQPVADVDWDEKRVILITGHRRESFGEPFRRVCQALRTLARANPDVEFVYPVHLNPRVREPVHDILSGPTNVHLTGPLNYLDFVWCMDRAHLLVTDSGGVQEEAPALGKPVLVTRDITERVEAVEAGTVKLVGTDMERIVTETQALLDDRERYQAMSRAINPYGDGRAAERIVDWLLARTAD